MIFMYFLKIVILFSPFIKDSIYMNIHILELNVAVSCSYFEEIEQYSHVLSIIAMQYLCS